MLSVDKRIVRVKPLGHPAGRMLLEAFSCSEGGVDGREARRFGDRMKSPCSIRGTSVSYLKQTVKRGPM